MDDVAFITEDEWSRISIEDRLRIVEAVKKDSTVDINIQSIKLPNSFYIKYGKRLIDILLGGIGFILFIPINLLIAIVTFFDVGSPIFFKQQRVGQNNKAFTLIKFRNMTNETNEEGILLPPSKRITRWGRFVRRTSLDELLNFWSIFKGDMSIIGPRPLPTMYISRYSTYQKQRHLVKPGLECPFHDKSLSNKGWQGRFENDIWYVENISFITDIKMVFLLVKKVFSKAERDESARGQIGEFIGCYPDGTAMDEFGIPRKYLNVVKNSIE